MLFLLQVTHKEGKRSSFPNSWTKLDSSRLVTLTREGEYWFKVSQTKPDFISATLTNLETGEVKHWEK